MREAPAAWWGRRSRRVCNLTHSSMTDAAFTFDPESHTYTSEGRVIPSVTQVIGASFPVWYAGEVALRRGSAVHRLTETYDRGERFDGTVEELAVALPYLRQWQRFLSELGVEIDPEWIERPINHPTYGYAGTPDRVIWIHEGDRTLLDIKTGAFHPNHRLQAAAYVSAANEEIARVEGPGKDKDPAVRISRAIGVYLRPDGYSLKTWDDTYDDFRVFLAALTVQRWGDEMRVQAQVPEDGWEPPANNEAFQTW